MKQILIILVNDISSSIVRKWNKLKDDLNRGKADYFYDSIIEWGNKNDCPYPLTKHKNGLKNVEGNFIRHDMLTWTSPHFSPHIIMFTGFSDIFLHNIGLSMIEYIQNEFGDHKCKVVISENIGDEE